MNSDDARSPAETANLGPFQGKVEPDDSVAIGQVVDGRYRIVKKLGEGGMGEVYAAEHIHISKRVAIKLLRSEILTNQEAVQRFRQEARSASSIGHPNIIAIEDFGELPDRRIYLCMELLSGQPLNDMIEQEIAPDRILDILIQTCHGLAAAHALGIVHRDMKPENIFVTRTPEGRDVPKLLDFGIAKVQGTDGDNNLTKTGMIFGTPFYMAPEQAMGEGIDHRADIYSMGVIMYEIFTGSIPFEGESFMGILTKHITAEPEPPSQRAARNGRGLLPGVEPVIVRAMKKEKADRYQNMDELIADLVSIRRTLVGPGMSAYMEAHPVPSGAMAAYPGSGPIPVPSGASGSMPGPMHSPSGSMPGPMHSPSGSMAYAAASSAAMAPTMAASSVSMPQASASASMAAAPPKGSKAGLIAALLAVLVVAGGIAGFLFLSGKKAASGQAGVTKPVDTDPEPDPKKHDPAGATDTGDKPGDTQGMVADAGSAAVGTPTVITPPDVPEKEPVKVLVISQPDGAEVVKDGEVLGLTPLNVDVVPGEPVALTLRRKRYEDMEISLDGAKDRQKFKLKKERRTTTRPGDSKPPDDKTGDLGLGLE